MRSVKVNGRVLRAIRTAQGMSVTELAKRSGTAQGHISNIELEDRGASAKQVVAIAQALHIDPLILQRNRDMPEPELVEYLQALTSEVPA
jgi:transcriptional regulator with XRE-family HTH domain